MRQRIIKETQAGKKIDLKQLKDLVSDFLTKHPKRKSISIKKGKPIDNGDHQKSPEPMKTAEIKEFQGDKKHYFKQNGSMDVTGATIIDSPKNSPMPEPRLGTNKS